jgi:hypothetical protein
MLTLYYSPGACSMAAHIVLEEGGQKYEGKKVNLAAGEQRTEEYLKIHPLGRALAHRLLCFERASGACPCGPTRTLHGRHQRLPGN